MKKVTCSFELRPFQYCGRPAKWRESVYGKPYCDFHAMLKERQFDLKMIRIIKNEC